MTHLVQEIYRLSYQKDLEEENTLELPLFRIKNDHTSKFYKHSQATNSSTD